MLVAVDALDLPTPPPPHPVSSMLHRIISDDSNMLQIVQLVIQHVPRSSLDQINRDYRKSLLCAVPGILYHTRVLYLMDLDFDVVVCLFDRLKDSL